MVDEGIASKDPSALQTVEFWFKVSKSTDVAAWVLHIERDGVYTYAPAYDEMRAGYNFATTMPTFLVEPNYEGEHNPGHGRVWPPGGEHPPT